MAYAPTVGSMSPDTFPPSTSGTSQTVVLTGSNFPKGPYTGCTSTPCSGPAVAAYQPGTTTLDPDVTWATSSNTTATSITASVTVKGTTPRDDDIAVIDSDGKTATCSRCLHVSNLTVGGVSPTSALNSSTAKGVTIKGVNLESGAAVKLLKAGVPTVTATNVAAQPDGSLTADLPLTNAAPGSYDIAVTNPVGTTYEGTAGCSGCFDVMAASPSISSVSPSKVGGGAAVTLTLQGDHLFPGAVVTFDDPDVHAVGAAKVTAPHTVTQDISIDGSASAADATATVTNTDGQAGHGAFTVDQGPVVGHLEPSSITPGTTTRVHIFGARFDPAATLQVAPATSGVTLADTTVASVTEIDTTVTADGSAPAGDRSLVITNPDRGTTAATLPVVATAPGPPQHVTATGGREQVAVDWAAPAADGGSPVTSYTVSVTASGDGSPAATVTADAATFRYVFTGLRDATTYRADVVATNKVGSSAPASATATTSAAQGTGSNSDTSGSSPGATSLSIADSAARIVFGRRMTLSGTLAVSHGSALAGRSVTVYRRSYSGRLSRVGAPTTDSHGGWRVTLAPAHNARYYAAFAGDTAATSSRSATVRTVVAPAVRVTRPNLRSRSRASHRLVISGNVRPGKPHRVVRLYSLKHGHLHLLRKVRLTRHSWYRFSVKLHRGWWRLRVYIGATPGNVAAHSAILRVRRT